MSTDKQIARSVCPLDCPDTCGLQVTLKEGRISKVDGDPDHPITQGTICHKVRHFPNRVYHPDRLLYPMKRVGPKGEGVFERISWEEALNEIVTRFKETIRDYGAESILPYSFYGNMGLVSNGGMDRRFFHRLGASRLKRTICNTAGSEGFQYTMGVPGTVDPEDTVHSRYIILWGGDFVSTNMHQMIFLKKARQRGAKIVTIDIRRTRTARWADEFVQLYPGTDAALALGIMNIIINEGLTNDDFIQTFTTGWKAFQERVKEYPPDAVARITGVPADTIQRLAYEYAKTSPSLIRIGNGLQHHDNGGMTIRTIACLPALTGQWKYPGGGALKGNGFFSVNKERLERPDLLPNPEVRSINMNHLGSVLLTAEPPVKCLFVYSSNPAVVAPDQEKVIRGLLREDLFTIVHDLFVTDTAKYADLILPATSHFENLDVYKSYWHLYVQLSRPVIPPQGEAWSNHYLFQTLANKMGFTESCFQDEPEEMIRQILDNPDNPYMKELSYEQLQKEGIVKLDHKKAPIYPDHLSKPEGKINLFSNTMKSRGMDPLPSYAPVKEGRDGTGAYQEAYPFMLISPPNHQFINSSMGNISNLRKMERKPELEVHPTDAQNIGLNAGDIACVKNHRGSCLLTVKVTEDVLPGVVVAPGLWWHDAHPARKGGINRLTPDREADMGGGAVFFSTAVTVEKKTSP
ncbi:molybdopterin-containing oxidoreductase family protein [Melghirimyces algeriensis]|uniref:Anaerobic selenocysteine-containing dehydrogenase n=1 Tax=Melghirimyces algeriensis TaxID=910412 RepID=A0A521EF28_9BACL|nr:molybdopterin oxidoreductase family protein [Melghirimyces algeriensis]SMO82543.1 Anaerobic selenocysteine-containing dehydrogenase [Melghirimyces algeriensis]